MRVVVGRIARPHGIRGEVAVEVRTDQPEARFAVGAVLGADPASAGPLTVRSARAHAGRLLVVFDEVGDRARAESLRGVWLTVEAAQVSPSADPDEFHDSELIGLSVVTTAGEAVGVVTEVRHHGQALLVVDPRAVPAGAGSAGAEPAGAGSAGAGSAGAEPAGAEPARGAPPWEGAELLIPFVSAIAVDVDVAAGRVVIDPPPGLLDLSAGGGS